MAYGWPMHQHGPLVGEGRDAQIFEYGPGTVLRRARNGHSMATEAKTMAYLHEHGYPVPAVEEISPDGRDLVMERIDGVPMLDAVARAPWTLRHRADQLAQLHQRLHELEPPGWLPSAPGAPGDSLVHLDLHPLNVLMTSAGPVVIDWTNVARGHWATDVALTWLVLRSAEIPGPRATVTLLSAARAWFARRFVSSFDPDEFRRHLLPTARWKSADPNLSEAESAEMLRLAERST